MKHLRPSPPVQRRAPDPDHSLDLLIQDAIYNLLCNGRVDFAELGDRGDVETRAFGAYVYGCRERLELALREGWVTWKEGVVHLENPGMMHLTRLTAALDPRLEEAALPDKQPKAAAKAR